MSDQWEAITDAAHQVHKDGGRELARLVIQADDLIEELQNQVNGLLRQASDNHDALCRAEAAEAKLARAVEALTRIERAKVEVTKGD